MSYDSCPICYEPSTNQYPLIILKCKHILCESCYQSWHVEQRRTHCCLCRQKIYSPNSHTPSLVQPDMSRTNTNNQNSECDILDVAVFINTGLFMCLGLVLIILSFVFIFKAIHTRHIPIVIISVFTLLMSLPYIICIWIYCIQPCLPLSSFQNVDNNEHLNDDHI